MKQDIRELNQLLKEKYEVVLSDEELQSVLEFYVSFISDLIGEN